MILNLNSSTDPSFNPRMLSPLTLAFIGDTVFDLFVREALIREANRPTNALHKLATEQVRASSQSYAASVLIENNLLTDEEISVFKRGRNAHSNHVPKHSTEKDYHMATGLETLFGYLYLSGHSDRLNELFNIVTDIYNSKFSYSESCK